MNEVQSKQCNDCKEIKPVSEFLLRKRGNRQYLNSYCNPCHSKRTVASNKKHKEKRGQYNKEYRQKHKEKFQVWDKEQREKRLENNPDYYAEYYQKNKERLREHRLKYYWNKREHYLELQKKYREKRKVLPPELKEIIKILNKLKKVIKDGKK